MRRLQQMKSLREILRERFECKYLPEPNSGCWLWTGGIDSKGYGLMAIPMCGMQRPAHRISYEIHKGPIPAGLCIDHLCRVHGCVNPDHLEAVTCKENSRRGASAQVIRKRMAARTHCNNGHPYAGNNLIISNVGHRRCRICDTVKNLKTTQRRRQESLAIRDATAANGVSLCVGR